MGRRKQQKPKKATETEDSKSVPELTPDVEEEDEEEEEEDGVSYFKKIRYDTSDRPWFEKPDEAVRPSNLNFDVTRFNAELAWLHWQQQQTAIRETRIKFGLSELGQKDRGESPLDLSSTVRGMPFDLAPQQHNNHLTTTPSAGGIHPWQQQLLLLKDKALERDAAAMRLLTSPAMPPPPPPPSSLALLRSFAALSEKLPNLPQQQQGFEPGQSLVDSHRALSALQQISQLTSQFSQTGNRLPTPTSVCQSPHFAQRPPMSLPNWPPMMVPMGCPPLMTSSPTLRTSQKFDLARDIFKCVICHERFNSLEGLTRHLKETDHGSTTDRQKCPTENLSPDVSPTSGDGRMTFSRSSSPSTSPKPTAPKSLSSSSSSSLPRKLVRGQDVWLGKGQEQTRQILKCMWCGQSFPSLADLTVHMQETRHYTKVISQEQIAAWNCGTSSPTSIMTSPQSVADGKAQVAAAAQQGHKRELNKSHISSVFTCKVCNSSFPSLRDLSVHIAMKNHQSDSLNSAGELPTNDSKSKVNKKGHPNNNNADRKKKALPVRKLLEIERASHVASDDDASDVRNGDRHSDDVIHCDQMDNDESESFEHQKKAGSSILGSLEKLVESSFSDLRPGSGNRKRSHLGTGNGILQRLGIDDDQPIQHQFSTKFENVTKKTQMSDTFRSSTWRQIESRRHSGLVDEMKNVDRDDVEDSEASDIATSASPLNVVAGSNPLSALKELCNNTCGTHSRHSKMVNDATSRSPSLSSTSTSSPSPTSIDRNVVDSEKIERRKKGKVDENEVVETTTTTQMQSSDDNDVTAAVENDVTKTLENNNRTIRVKNDCELLRSARNRRTRANRNETSHNDALTSHCDASIVDNKKAENSTPSDIAASQSSTEAKFFRYSELAKVLAAGN